MTLFHKIIALCGIAWGVFGVIAGAIASDLSIIFQTQLLMWVMVLGSEIAEKTGRKSK